MSRVRVRSYFRKDGTRVRSHSRSGVARGGPAAAVGAAAVAAAVGLGGAVSGGAGTTAPPGPSAAQLKVKVQERNARTQRNMTLRLGKKGYQVRTRTRFDGTDCAGHAYGDVAAFFRDRPCLALGRMSFEVKDRRGKVVLVAVSSVAMPDRAGAGAYKRLVDRHGTGNVTELTREQGRYRSVRFLGRPYGSRPDGLVVTNVQAQPVDRGPGDAVLRMMMETALS
jgi:hypothetical protein